MEDATISPIRDQGKYGGAIEEQRISTQVWRIPRKRININVLKERVEENVGVYGKEDCSIPTGMGKYIPVQTNRELTGDVLIEISNKTKTGIILPEISTMSRRN